MNWAIIPSINLTSRLLENFAVFIARDITYYEVKCQNQKVKVKADLRIVHELPLLEEDGHIEGGGAFGYLCCKRVPCTSYHPPFARDGRVWAAPYQTLRIKLFTEFRQSIKILVSEQNACNSFFACAFCNL